MRGQAGPNPNRWAVLGMLTAVYACHYIDRSIVSIVIEPVRVEFRLSDKQLGLLLGLAYSLPYSLFVIPLGLLADRVNRARLLSAVLFVWSGMTALCGIAGSYLTLLVARGAVGAAEAGASPTCMSLITDHFPPVQRSTAIGVFFLASAIGTVITYGGGGFIVEAFGWRGAFIAAGVPGLVLTVVLLLFLRDGARTARSPVHKRRPVLHTVGGWLRTPAFDHLAVAGFLSTGVVAGVWSWAPSFFIREHGLNISEAGLIVAAGAGGCGALGSLASGRLGEALERRLPGRMPMLPAFTSTGLFGVGVLFALVDSMSAAIVSFLLWSFLATTFMAPYFATILSLARSEDRGFATSVLQLLNNLVGYAGGPLLVGAVSEASGSLALGMAALAGVGLWAACHYAFAAWRGVPLGLADARNSNES